MRNFILALVVAMAACLAAAAAAAAADPGPIQVSGQSAGTSQRAAAASSATQIDPSNKNISIRVLSPGNDGDVTQSNNAASSAAARQPELHRPVGQPGRRWQRDPDLAAGCGHGSGCRGALGSVAARPVEHERRDPGSQPRERRLRDAVEQRRFTCRRRQRRVDDAVRHPEPVRLLVRLQRQLDAGADVRPVGVDGPVGGGTLGGEAGRSVEHRRVDPRLEPR